MRKMFSSAIRVPILSWSPYLEAGALRQLVNIARLPFVFKHVVENADGHQGYGMPIGGVAATEGVISPNFVGKDIGCGMHAVRLNITDLDVEIRKRIMSEIRLQIPVGFNHRKAVDSHLMPLVALEQWEKLPIVKREFDSARTQIGTLGGGNHFIEMQKGSDGNIWFMIHSGSRNIGSKVADHYDKIAKELNAKWHSKVPVEHDLAFLPVDTLEGQMYLEEMNYCLAFAKSNREMMARIIKYIFKSLANAEALEEHDIHHNYAALENHFGRNVWVHRKGATRAYEGEIGLIPGSQGSASYVVKGKGNILSFKSCSHGAGRAMSRTKAEATLDLEAEKKRLDDQGILHSIRCQADLDEATGAYKDIAEVMANQTDLVEIMVELKPLAVVKDNTKKRKWR